MTDGMTNVMSQVDQVIPKLGDSYWPIMEHEFVRVFKLKQPDGYDMILNKTRAAMLDAGFLNA